MKHAPWLSIPLAAALFACDGTTDPQARLASGLAALNSGEPGKAADELSRALEGLPPGDPAHLRVQVALTEALAAVDPAASRDRFLAFARSNPDAVEDAVLRRVSEAMFRAGACEQALDVLRFGVERAPGRHGAHGAEPLALALAQLERRVAGQASEDELAHLRSLGYLGGD